MQHQHSIKFEKEVCSIFIIATDMTQNTIVYQNREELSDKNNKKQREKLKYVLRTQLHIANSLGAGLQQDPKMILASHAMAEAPDNVRVDSDLFWRGVAKHHFPQEALWYFSLCFFTAHCNSPFSLMPNNP